MIQVEITLRLVNGKLQAPYQNEVENIAIETMGTHEDIYFARVPINDKFYLKWDDNTYAWMLRKRKEKNVKRDSTLKKKN